MRRRTVKRARQERDYLRRSRAWLAGKVCAVCQVRPATECHHMRGRVGVLLLDEQFWLPTCSDDHRFITEHPRWAFEHGYSLRRVGAA